MKAVIDMLPAAGLLLVGLLLFAAMVFLTAAAWFGRARDPRKGDYRDATGVPYGKLDEKQRVSLIQRTQP